MVGAVLLILLSPCAITQDITAAGDDILFTTSDNTFHVGSLVRTDENGKIIYQFLFKAQGDDNFRTFYCRTLKKPLHLLFVYGEDHEFIGQLAEDQDTIKIYAADHITQSREHVGTATCSHSNLFINVSDVQDNIVARIAKNVGAVSYAIGFENGKIPHRLVLAVMAMDQMLSE